MHHGHVKKKESFDVVPRMFGFIRPGCYGSIVNNTNFRNDSEQHEHRFIFFIFHKHYLKKTLLKALSKS